ncbi:flagellar assembly protein FliX [Pararhodospirillum oryzae]|uniref:Flagellar assembly protein FliX n=1 Tax=Pararhodospirillum oryzae TaxID=478448 RepID=A0A512H8R2_9PROT|nr:flagellar assembly protein FliX [Pararhodospirillum oryzae]GEO81790.1 flagellar assembly protein FliX [Pararhodospirillum oryzae]
MRIGGIRPGDKPAPRKTDRAGKSERGAFDRALRSVLGLDADSTPVEGTAPLSGVEGLLALQEVDASPAPSEREARRQGTAWGTQVLDDLDRLRLAMLDGAIPVAVLDDLAQSLRARAALEEAPPDPRLSSLLDAIELRAEVERAKLDRP